MKHLGFNEVVLSVACKDYMSVDNLSSLTSGVVGDRACCSPASKCGNNVGEVGVFFNYGDVFGGLRNLLVESLEFNECEVASGFEVNLKKPASVSLLWCC